MTVPTNQLSEDTCKVCALGMKYTGSGAVINMVSDLSDVTIAGNQAFTYVIKREWCNNNNNNKTKSSCN